MITSELFVLIEIIICFLEGPLVVPLIFSFPSFIPLLLVTLYILIILLDGSFMKVSLILMIFLILSLNI